MEIISKTDGTKVTMEVVGWLDTQTAPQLEEELSKLTDEITSLVFDFAKLEYISSAGLRQVIALLNCNIMWHIFICLVLCTFFTIYC